VQFFFAGQTAITLIIGKMENMKRRCWLETIVLLKANDLDCR
jgi:hypothetical protein